MSASDTDRPTVAVLGTGTMGAPMARNVAAAGLPVRAWNRTAERARPLADADGITVHEDAAEAVRGARVVVTMVDAEEAVRAAIDAAAPGLDGDAVWVQMATVGVAAADRLARRAAELGVVFVDAPVLGTKGPAEQGKLTVLYSGPEETRDLLEPVFDAVGARTMWLGPAGTASRLKVVANGWLLTVVAGVAEGLALAEGLGLEPELFPELIEGSALDVPYLQMKGEAILDEDWTPSFSALNGRKDAGLVVEAARDAGVPISVAGITGEYLQAAIDAGHGDEDLAAAWRGLTGR